MPDSPLPSIPEIRLCHITEIPTGTARSFEMDGRLLAVFHTRDGQVVGSEGRCPHKGGPLADGMVINQHIVCPLHGAGFSLADGKCDRADLSSIRLFPVRLLEGWIILGLTAKEQV